MLPTERAVVSLHIGLPTRQNLREVAYSGYERVRVEDWRLTDGGMANEKVVKCPACRDHAIKTITHFMVHDADTGEAVLTGLMRPPIVVGFGVQPVFYPGGLSFGAA